ncbi:MAG: hypothetical protein PHI96_03920 [Desulfovibrio sp.]|nr:hypothetical protein [Desulfovibrio sp.]
MKDVVYIIFFGGLFLTLLSVVFAAWIHPNIVIERIAMKALETYQAELRAGIKPEDSKVKAMLQSISKREVKKND